MIGPDGFWHSRRARIERQPVDRPLVLFAAPGVWFVVVRRPGHGGGHELEVARWSDHAAALADARQTAVEPLPSAVDLAEQRAAA